MAIRNIVTLDDEEILRKISRPVLEFNERLHRLLDDMHDTLKKADGVGLAAPQVGVLRRVCIVDTGDLKVELINPVITYASEETVIDLEGCLSIPEHHDKVPRPQKVTVNALDRNGKAFSVTAEDFDARALCHEIDHLNGILYVDKAVKK